MSEHGSSLTNLIHSAFRIASGEQELSLDATTGQREDAALRGISIIESAKSLSESLSIISENDNLRDITTRSLRILFLDSLKGELELQVRTPPPHQDPDARKERLKRSIRSNKAFLYKLDRLSILPASTKSLISQQTSRLVEKGSSSSEGQDGDSFLPPLSSSSSSSLGAASNKRELKIALFKLERALKQGLDEFRRPYRERLVKRRKASSSSSEIVASAPTDAYFDPLILPSGAGGSREEEGEDEDEDEDEDEEDDRKPTIGGTEANSQTAPWTLRQYLLLLLNLHAVRASSSLDSSHQELELLDSMPPPSEDPARSRLLDGGRERGGREGEDSEGRGAEWRLDSGWFSNSTNSGPLMDPKGRPLRPFTITSGSSSAAVGGGLDQRQQLRNDVFRPGHRLPTMSIDEYLEEEARRGNIITGGGHEGAAKPTPREERSLRAEQDGTREAEEAEEEARREAIHWDEFKESNRRGAGNTMNRG
ncbi:TAP42-domain-containing protein [Violaceomyces palustris]|uniref:TAP42-domain-containing protein n=1 Tax=Violaceomyces palustris TaxID=1673888 RepID=A0ACD0NRV2_9BASI|nr:TAP42-domain-containing protein [Violaceomyces palustris]